MKLDPEDREELNRFAVEGTGRVARLIRLAIAYIDWLERDAESLIERVNELIRKEEWGKKLCLGGAGE